MNAQPNLPIPQLAAQQAVQNPLAQGALAGLNLGHNIPVNQPALVGQQQQGQPQQGNQWNLNQAPFIEASMLKSLRGSPEVQGNHWGEPMA